MRFRCAACHVSCETCRGSNSSQCVSCADGHFWHDGSCIRDCPAHHYADLQQRECIECQPGCSECNKTTCISCLDDWQINTKGRCVPHGSDKCDMGKYRFSFLLNNKCNEGVRKRKKVGNHWYTE